MDIQLTQNVYANSILLYNYFHIKVGVSTIVELKNIVIYICFYFIVDINCILSAFSIQYYKQIGKHNI